MKLKLFVFLLSIMHLHATPIPPTDLTLQPLSSTSIKLTWIDHSNDEKGFKVYRDGELITTVLTDITSFIDTKLLPNTTYTYEVRATDKLENDRAFIYQNQALDINISKDKQSVKITRKDDNKTLIDTNASSFYIDYAQNKLSITHQIVQKQGGVDIEYRITNNSDQPQLLPDLQLSGIKLAHDDKLDILNNYRLYFEERLWADNLHKDENFYLTGSHIGVYNENLYEDSVTYGGQTNGLYAPVIVARDDSFAIGTSLNYPFLEYTNAIPIVSKHSTYNKLYPHTRIFKDSDDWRYNYHFDGMYIATGKTYNFTIPIRFSEKRDAILTLYPYKNHMQYLYKAGIKTVPKDTAPTLFSIWAFNSNDNDANNPRAWNYAFGKEINGTFSIPLVEVANGLKTIMLKKGYTKILLSSFSGMYQVPDEHPMNDELPFEFIKKHPNQNQLPQFFQILHDGGLKYNFWWGIAGMMPVDKNGVIITNDNWSPATDVVFDFSNQQHRAFAQTHLQSAIDNHADGLALDAYVRMEEKTALTWLDMMITQLEDTKLSIEINHDIYHSRGAIFLQPIDESLDKEKNRINKPPLLAQYLNPNAEVQVFMQHRYYDTIEAEKTYMQELVKMGYTPQIIINNNGLANSGNADNIQKRLEEGGEFFVDVNGLNNSIIYKCFDGIDNDNDGKTDFPYDKGCTSTMDNNE